MPPRAETDSLTSPWRHPLLGMLQSRVVMSAMTRSAAGPGGVPTAEMVQYYAKRARHGVGLILTESTPIAPVADGFPHSPGIFSPEQEAGWRRVTDAVHAAGAPIFCQLLHCGRITHQDYTGGLQPVSATDRAAEGINRRNGKAYAVPRRLEASELPGIIDEYRRAGAGAVRAGFDGVELHLAHGYLPDQFLDAHVNDRSDDHGGSVANRCRFALALTEAMVSDLGAARVIARISPSRWMGGLYEWPDLHEMLAYLVPGFHDAGLRMLDISCARAEYDVTSGRIVQMARPRWPHFLMAGASLSAQDAQAELDAGRVDMVTYARALIANPDLVERLRDSSALVPYETSMLDTLI